MCYLRGVRHFWLPGWAVVVCLLVEPGILEARQRALPDAADVLDRYVEATGGQAVYDKIHNSVSKVRVVHVEMEFEDKAIFYAAAPNKRYMEVESEAFGPFCSGTDGSVAWYLAEHTGPLVLEGDARSAQLHASAFNWPGRWRSLYEKVKCIDEAVVEGKTCRKLAMTSREGHAETLYFDKESGLLIKAERTRLFTGMPPMPTTYICSDYRQVDGLLVAHKVKQIMQQCGEKREMLFVITSLRHNVDLPASRFAPPKEILAVLASGSATSRPSSASGCRGSSGASRPAAGKGKSGPSCGSPSAKPAAGACGGGGAHGAGKGNKKPQSKGSCCGG